MGEIASQIINMVLASGLVGTFIFYHSKARKARAEAVESEHASESKAIENFQKTTDEWQEIANERKSEIERKDKLIDTLYEKQQSDRDVILTLKDELSQSQYALRGAQIKSCNVRGCINRNPPNEFY